MLQNCCEVNWEWDKVDRFLVFLHGAGGVKVYLFEVWATVWDTMISSAIKVVCFVYQHPYTDAKNENLQKQLYEKKEMGKHPYEAEWSGQL